MIPGADKPGFELKDDEIELGLGIHGEPGVSKETLLPVNELVDRILKQIVSNINVESSNVVVMINGLVRIYLKFFNFHFNNMMFYLGFYTINGIVYCCKKS